MDRSPEHFELSDLIDYVRRAGPADRLAAMEQHLEVERCERCRRAARMLSEAYGAARELARIEVPETCVRRAKAIFQPTPAAAWLDLPAIAAKLISPTGPEFAFEGLRATGSHGQQVFESGPVRVRLEILADAAGCRTVVGGLAYAGDSPQSLASWLVFAATRDSIIAHTRTSDFGEFYLDLPDRRRLRLIVVPPGESSLIEIDLAK